METGLFHVILVVQRHAMTRTMTLIIAVAAVLHVPMVNVRQENALVIWVTAEGLQKSRTLATHLLLPVLATHIVPNNRHLEKPLHAVPMDVLISTLIHLTAAAAGMFALAVKIAITATVWSQLLTPIIAVVMALVPGATPVLTLIKLIKEILLYVILVVQTHAITRRMTLIIAVAVEFLVEVMVLVLMAFADLAREAHAPLDNHCVLPMAFLNVSMS